MRKREFVFLDAQGTVLQAKPSLAAIYGQVCHSIDGAISEERIGAATRGLWEEYKASLDLDSASFETSDELTRLWWANYNGRLFDRLGLANGGTDGREAFVEALWEVFGNPAQWQLFPDVEESIEGLRSRGYRLAIVSNWDSRLFTICERLGLTSRVEFIVASAPAGIEKPDPRIFEMALARAGTTAGEAIHVGDDYLADVVGARRAGVEPVYLNRDGGPAPSEPVTTIRSLTELLELLP